MDDYDQMDADLEVVKGHVARLMEHFESVQIFASRRQDGGTVNCQYGDGNWFARYGQIHAWAIRQDQEICNDIIEP